MKFDSILWISMVVGEKVTLKKLILKKVTFCRFQIQKHEANFFGPENH